MNPGGQDRTDVTSLVAGLAALVLGVVLGLDRAGAIDVGWAALAPLALAALGAVLLSSGLSRPR